MRNFGFCLLITAVLLCGARLSSADDGDGEMLMASPESVGMISSQLNFIDEAVAASMKAKEIPGAVVLVARHGQIAYLKAFGNRSVKPSTEPMTVDTIFDISSLTKVVATLPSIMLLVENGTLRIEDKVKHYLPKFTGDGKDDITVRHLLNHYSGLPAGFDLSRKWSGTAEALEELWDIDTDAEPGREFKYSDLNFIALGEIVRVLSGMTLDVFAKERIFSPLGMRDTCFRPPASLAARIAPTEPRRNERRSTSANQMIRGEVHDPTAWRMGGVAGHAGLFSTARDLAVFAQMLLNRGSYAGKRLLSPLGVAAMISPQSPADQPEIRGFGWDIHSTYSAPKGDLFYRGVGHSGFTGVSLWIHPATDTSIILLTSRLHPEGGKSINHLRAVVANIVAASILDPDEKRNN